MKALRSRWVSGGLAALALAFIAYQLMSGLHGRNRPSAVPPAPAAISAPAVSAPVAQGGSVPRAGSVKASQLPARDGMDQQLIGLHFTNWAMGARRDPFLLQAPTQQNGTNAPSQLANWKLKAIWHQTGSRVAVLNNALYEEGDSIEGYKIIRIEDEVVWLQNANSLDHLELRKPQGPVTAARNGQKNPAL